MIRDWHQHETWNERLKALMISNGMKQVDLARKAGVKESTVNGWMTGNIKNLKADNAEKICSIFGISQQSLLKGTKPTASTAQSNTNVVTISRLNIAGSMGEGALRPYGNEEVIEEMTASKDWLRRTIGPANPSNLAIISAYGDSMEGTFSDGDLLLVDKGITEVKVDAVYVLALGEELYIKRLQRRPDGVILMLSDNPKYSPFEIDNGRLMDFQVLGRVLLAWNTRKL